MGERAVVFPGQGAQTVGMGRDLAENYEECRELYRRADEVLGWPLSRLCFEGPLEELTRTDRCQPAVFVTSVACYTALRREVPGVTFHAAAGLSLGEWTALYSAGVVSFEDTLQILAARGRFMQEACEERDGTMMSVIGLTAGQVAGICTAAGCEIANLNGGGQIVVSGAREAVLRAERMAKEAGAKRAVILTVAGAFHSSLMTTAAKKLEAFLQSVTFHPPARAWGGIVMSNVTGEPHPENGEEIRRAMVRQVTSPVRWEACILALKNRGVTEYVECGPGRVLSGLIRRIDGEAVTHNVENRSDALRIASGLNTSQKN
ncbi:MAG: ACP S-malonyltransferase [Kiritimatiellia bacterium]